DITHSMTLPTETRHQNFIVLLSDKENKNSYFLAVLDELNPDALPNSRVGLLGFHTTVRVTGIVYSSERVGLQSCAQMGLLVLFIVPLLLAAVTNEQISCSSQGEKTHPSPS
uniref:VWFA domain-containing protein n=1 Tax=Electrophorus electricus TaxID=8005 RepID=A0A4W4FAK5_ELEEL